MVITLCHALSSSVLVPCCVCAVCPAGRVLAGAYPASLDDVETEQLLTLLLELGVTTFVCLQAEVNIHIPGDSYDSARLDLLPGEHLQGSSSSRRVQYIHSLQYLSVKTCHWGSPACSVQQGQEVPVAAAASLSCRAVHP